MIMRPAASTVAAALASLCLLSSGTLSAGQPFTLALKPIGTYASGIFNRSAAEIVAHDPGTQRLFVVNALSGEIDVIGINDPTKPVRLFSINLSGFGAAVNSVAAQRGLVVAAVESAVRTDPGQAVFLNTNGDVLAAVTVGALPDMVTFTPDGKRVLVANEGEPSADYLVDPEGSVSIIDLPNKIDSLDQQHVRTADFRVFNDVVLDPAIRIFGPNASVAQDLEPEYITVSADAKTAWVALQENNAIAVLDIAGGRFTALRPLGFKDHSLPGNELDASDRDRQINIRNWPALGMYLPDAISSYQYQGRSYIVTANEGDARDYPPFYSEEARFRALAGANGVNICPDAPQFQGHDIEMLRNDANMGRLLVTNASGKRADGSCYEAVYSFGARSFSIWNSDVELVWDSGSEFERVVGDVAPAFFNSNHAANNFDGRSASKGPEPEAVAIAKLWGRTYGFIGLERVGGVFIYDISNPYAPRFVQYFNNRDFTQPTNSPAAGDLGTEDIIVIEADKSPIPGVPLLVVANEVSGTTTVFQIDRVHQVGQE